MAKRVSILILAFCLCVVTSWAQTPECTEAETVTRGALLNIGAEVEKKLTRGLNLGFEGEARFKEMTNFAKGVNHMERLELGLKMTYKVCDYVRVGGGYAYRAYLKDGKESTNWENYWSDRHVVHLEATASYKVSQWKFSLRLRPELTVRTDSINILEKVRNFFELRTRLQAEYEFRSVPVEIFAYVEMFNTLNAINPNKTLDAVYAIHGMKNPGTYYCAWNGQYINDIRASVGISYRFDKRNSLKVYYRFFHDIGRDIHLNGKYAEQYADGSPKFKEFTVTRELEYNHMLGIGYSYSF